LVRGVIKDIGYTSAAYGFDYETCAVMTTIDKQSPDIATSGGSKTARAIRDDVRLCLEGNSRDDAVADRVVAQARLTRKLGEYAPRG
jgi:S-adenosylmethionine synthetase